MSWVPLLGVVLSGGVLPSGGALQAQDAIEVLIDNDDEGTSSVGDWGLSRRGTNFGPDARVSANNSEGNTYTFDFEVPKSGDYEVFLWWTTRFFSASSNVPVDITHENGTTTVFVDQRTNGGKWNRIGTHLLGAKGSVTVRAPDSRRTTVDGLRLLRVPNERPEPTIVEITPNPANEGESVTFRGEGSDEDGSVIAYAWNSSIDGQLSEDAMFSTTSLTVGEHEISFRVQDDDLQWSEAATATLSIEAEIPNEPPTATIDGIDPSPAVEGDTISFNGESSDADGEVIAWAWASSIEGELSDDEDFATASLSVGEHEVTFRVQDNDLTWSEVASTLLRVDALPNVAPTSTIKEIVPSPAAVGEEIFFNGSSNDPDGQVSARRWNSSLDGQLSTKQDFVSSSLSIGVHEILYEVRDNDGEWSDGARTMLEVFEPLDAEIVLESLEASGGVVPPGAFDIQVKILSSSPTPLEVDFAGRRMGTDEEFTVVVLPDTQNYVDSGRHPEVFTAQTQWIVDNKETENIVFVSHAGDVVDHADSQLEWDLANESMSLLDGVLPYGISPGNHDQDIHLDLPEGATGTLYPDYFPASRFENENWYGGNFPAGTNWNSYQLISAGGVDFIFLHVQFCPSADEVAWADAVLKGHSERRAVLITHGFIDEFGNRAVGHCEDTQYIWDGIVVPNENLEILLCAHMKTEHLRTDLVGERRVYQILANY